MTQNSGIQISELQPCTTSHYFSSFSSHSWFFLFFFHEAKVGIFLMWTWVGVGMLWVLQSGLLDIARLFEMHCQLVYCRLVKIPLPHIKNYRDLQSPKSHNCHPHIFCGGLKFFMHLLRVLHLHFTMQNCVTNYVSSRIMRKSHWQHAHPNGRGRENQFQQNNVLT